MVARTGERISTLERNGNSDARIDPGEVSSLESSLRAFARDAWSLVEPGRPFVDGWHIGCICFPYWTPILTRGGYRPIGEIVESGLSVDVLSYNHATGCAEWKAVTHGTISPGAAAVRIETADGRVIEPTANHPVYVEGRGYVRADSVQPGDTVYVSRVQGAVSSHPVAPARGLLQPQVRGRGEAWQADSLCRVREGRSEPKSQRFRPLPLVLRQEPSQWPIAPVPAVRKAGLQIICGTRLYRPSPRGVLRPPLSRRVYAGGEQPVIHGRPKSQGLSARVSRGSAGGNCPRAGDVFSVLGTASVRVEGRASAVESRSASHRLEQGEQRTGKPGVTLSPVSLAPARNPGEDGRVYGSAVVSVGPALRVHERVYNLEVDGNHNYFAAGVLVHNCEHLAAVTNLQINNLLINIPPRHGKSLLVAVFWFAWVWTFDPASRWLTSSYADDLVSRDAMKSHALIDTPWYQRRWGHRFGWGKKDTDAWYENTATGYRISTTVGGKATGHGGDYLIVDDPLKALDARSAAARLRVIEWWTKTMSTRINDPKKVRKVVVMQRLHECLLPGTPVRTPFGQAPIQDLRAGDIVFGSSGWQAVTACGSRDYAGIAYGVRLYGHRSVCWTTDNHEYLTRRGWVRADSLTAEDWIRFPNPPAAVIPDVPWEPVRRASPPRGTGAFTGSRADSISKDVLKELVDKGLTNSDIARRLGVHRNTNQCYASLYGLSRIRDRNPWFGTSHLSDPDFWRLVGYWIAEGSFIRGRGKPVGVVFTFGYREQKYADDVAAVLRRYGITSRCTYPPSVARVESCCRQLAAWLNEHFGCGALNKRLPEFVMSLSGDCRKELLAGWMRGDGCVRAASGELAGTTSSLALAHGMQRLILSLGMPASVVTGVYEPERVVIDGRDSGVNCGVSHEVRFGRPVRDESRVKSQMGDGCCWFRIRKIETKDYVGPVYDIETPSHDFVVGNATVHNSDLSGYLAARQDTEGGYETLVLPAEYEPKRVFVMRPDPKPRDAIIQTSVQRARPELADPRSEDGELLWPDRFGPKEIADLKIELEADGVAGQLQQRPSPADGTVFQRGHFRYATVADTALGRCFLLASPDGKEAKRVQVARCRFFQTVDTAQKTKQSNDPTAVGTFAVTPDGDLIVYHMVAARIEIPYQLAFLKAMRKGPAIWSKADKRVIPAPFGWPRPLLGQWVEDASSGTMLLTSGLAEGIVFRTLKAAHDKVQRAAPLSALYEAGRVYHLRGGAWLVSLEDELATFPASANDDQTDVCAYAATVALYDAIVRAGMAGLEEIAAQYAEPDPDDPGAVRRPWLLESGETLEELPDPVVTVSLGVEEIDSHDAGSVTTAFGEALPDHLPPPDPDTPEGDWPDVFNPPPSPAAALVAKLMAPPAATDPLSLE